MLKIEDLSGKHYSTLGVVRCISAAGYVHRIAYVHISSIPSPPPLCGKVWFLMSPLPFSMRKHYVDDSLTHLMLIDAM